MKKLAVLASGQGSNLQALIEAISHGELPAQIVVVISDKPHAKALARAIDASIPAESVVALPKESRQDYDRRLAEILTFYHPDFIVMAGFMRILSAEFIANYPHRIVNIHPSLLPNYPGLNTYQRVLSDQCQWHGTTVHFVNEALDQGPIIAQVKIPVDAEDNVERLQQKTQHQEHRLYPQVLGWLCHDLVKIKQGKVWLGDEMLPEQGKQVPQRT